jgi:hypothetical protein
LAELTANAPTPAEAGEIGGTKVTGNLVYKSEFTDENPAYYPWNDGNVQHVRNAIYTYHGDFSDNRLDGDNMLNMSFDGDEESTLDTYFWGRFRHEILVLDKFGKVIWAGEALGESDEQGNGKGEGRLTGFGVNKGLIAKLTYTDNLPDDASIPVVIEGVIEAGD